MSWTNGKVTFAWIATADCPDHGISEGDFLTDEEYRAITVKARLYKASDIHDDLLMLFIKKQSMRPLKRGHWTDNPDSLPRWVWSWDFENHPYWDDIPWKVVVAKINRLNNRGLISACTCGCRMDIELTDKGHEYISNLLAEFFEDQVSELVEGSLND